MSIVTSTLHNHTTLCDGKSTPREMIEAAIRAGFTDFGISGHAYMAYETEYTIKDEPSYIAAIRPLQAEYAGRIRLWLGIEQDFCEPVKDRSAFQYLIGSVHTFECGDGWRFAVDDRLDTLRLGIDRKFGGDALAMTEGFYRQSAENALRFRPDIIGHFDLVVKLNKNGCLFDEDSPRYRRAALEALDACCETGRVFEVNTGAVARGYRDTPYPAPFLLRRLHENGARITLSADAHSADAITFRFPQTLELLRTCGFGSVVCWEDGRWIERGI